MADKKISQLTSLAPALNTDELPINRSNASGKLTVSDILVPEATIRAAKDGDLTTLTTTAKTNLVSAINEVNSGLSTKIPTSYLDADTSLTANSDSKIATQKATKAYVLANVTPSATESVQGKAEIATQVETNTGTDDTRFITPLKLKTNLATYNYLGGTGTSRNIPLYSSTNTLGDSAIKQSTTGTRILLNGVTDDTATAFQVSGTTHVLSVSGMHIALLFAFISFLIEVISLRKYKSKLVQLCIIPLLWIYAFFTGFSAPVIRAVGFFSYYLLANVLFGRALKLLHVLMVVGIIQLLANPLALWDIGFQLSYLAVLGLSTILPFIKGFYEDRPYWQRLIFDAFAISISSTITTYPLSLYCFHQFSVWFLLGNLLLLPMFTLLMYWLFVMVFLTAFSVPLHWVVFFLNKYLNGVPPSILTKIGTKLYTLTSEKPRSIRVIIQITLSPFKYCKYLFNLFRNYNALTHALN
jgi:ComEC/Rec2-related protein